MLWTLVIPRGSGEEDPAVLEVEFRVANRAVGFRDAIELAKAESALQPVDRGRGILVGDHRNDPSSLGAGFLDHGSPGARMSWGVLNTGVPGASGRSGIRSSRL